MANVATRIRSLRKENNMKQKQVAEYLGITQQSYSYYEQNKRELPARHIMKIAELYNVSTDFILGTQPRRAGTFELNAAFIQDISLKNILMEMNKLNKANRQEFIRFLFYLNRSQKK